MSDLHRISEDERTAFNLLVEALAAKGRAIPTTMHVTIREAAEPDSRQFDGVLQIAERYATLTHPLPLAGAEALTLRRDGQLAIIAHLRADMPWLAAAIETPRFFRAP